MNIIKNPKVIIIVAVSIVVIGAGFAGWYFLVRDTPAPVSQTTSNPEVEDTDNVNLAPPTPDEQKAGDKQKENLPDETTPTPSSGQKKVTPIFVSSGQFNGMFEVSSRVPGVVEDGGVCTLKLTKDGKSFTASKKGNANVSETSCGFIGIERSKLSAGTWTATITYESPKAKGTSKPVAVEVD